MIECPEFDYDYQKSHAVYLACLHGAFIASFIVNPLIMYCIVFRSPRHMASYRWFLLLHQIAAFVADLWISFFCQAIFVIPFSIGYLLGYAKHYITSISGYSWGHCFLVFEQITVVLLFFIRYQIVHHAQTIPLKWKFFLFLLVLVQIVNTYLPLSIKVTTEETFQQLAKEYSCITPRLRNIDGIDAFDKTQGTYNSFGLVLFFSPLFLIVVSFLVVCSWRATRTESMSPKLRQMQQRFLIQLCIQSLVPFFVVVVPFVLLMSIVVFDIFGYSWMSDVVFASGSLFSIISAVTLFIMNPSYHRWLTRWFTKKPAILQTVSSLKTIDPI